MGRAVPWLGGGCSLGVCASRVPQGGQPCHPACLALQETWYWDASNVTEMVLSGVKCAGHEMSLSHCQHHGTSLNCRNTGTRFAAGVICSESEQRGGAAGSGVCGQWGLQAAGSAGNGGCGQWGVEAVGSAGNGAGGCR